MNQPHKRKFVSDVNERVTKQLKKSEGNTVKQKAIHQAKKQGHGASFKDNLKQLGKTAQFISSPFTVNAKSISKRILKSGTQPNQKGGLKNIQSVNESFHDSDYYKYAIFSDGAYKKNHDEQENVLSELGDNHGWTLDKDHSHEHTSVYYNNDEVVIAYRGTANLTGDLLSDAAIAVGMEANNGRFKKSEKEFLDIASKYADKKITTTGHSLGGSIAKHVQGKYTDIVDETHIFNAGSGFNTAIDPTLNNSVHSHHILGDPISALGTHNAHNVHVYKPKKANVHSLSNFTQK